MEGPHTIDARAQSAIPSRLRKFWQRIRREKAQAAELPSPAPTTLTTPAGPAIEIAPDDPLVAYLQRNPGVVNVERLPLVSSALQELKNEDVKIIIPLISQGELIGMINLGPRLSEQEYSAEDRRMFEDLAVQAAPAFRIAQLVRQRQAEMQARDRVDQQLRLARVIQQTLLPKDVPRLPGWKITAYYQPAWEVGGDFYDFIPFPDGRIGIVVGDVTDKGLPSAIVMATTRSVLRSAAERFDSPGKILNRANNMLYDDIPPNMFVTCFFLLLEPATGRICFANAGHDLPFHRTNGDVNELRATGMPLGLMPEMEYDEKETHIAAGDVVLLYSDGLAEAHSPTHEMLGFPRLAEEVQQHTHDSPLVDYLLDRLKDFTGPDWVQEDDVTIVALERDLPVMQSESQAS